MKGERKTNLKKHAILLAGFAAALFASCEANDVYNRDAAITSTSELTAPSGFDWKTTTSASLTVTADVNTYVSVYSDKACTDHSLLIENAAIEAGKPQELTLHIPTSQTAVYVQYPVAADRKEVAQVQLGTTRASGSLTLPTDYETENGWVLTTAAHYPSKGGFGTLMFEDLYPDLGDYDFNDLVMRYNANFQYYGDEFLNDGPNFTLTFKISAIGGVHSQTPMLRLKGFKMSNLNKEGVNVAFTSSYPGIEMKLVEGRTDDQDALFAITGLDNLRKDGFFNTDPDKASVAEIPTLTCKVSYASWVSSIFSNVVSNLAENFPSYFDFFLSNEQGQEIHFYGFNPTDRSNMASDTEFRHPTQNLVWAIAIPEEIGYPKERVDILNVFGDRFSQWVTSGGSTNKDWYNSPVNKDKLY